MRKTIIILLSCLPFFNMAQVKGKQNPKFTIRGMVGIPKTISSQMYRGAFNGVVETGLSANIRVAGNSYVGLGYQYDNFVLRKEAWFASSVAKQGSNYYGTKIIGHSGFFKIGFDKFFSEIGYVSYSLNTGFMTANYKNLIASADTLPENLPKPGTVNFSAPYLQPELCFNFLAEKSVSFSVLISYTTLFYQFDPKAARLNHIKEVRDGRNRYYMSWINIGFGFNVLLGK